ncbi:MAG: sigma-54-dependent Fis family transcriptional regulator [Planctomycetaceae bacterium]|nr:sigma-54-dependent Fis family transcriptional regulator [Planctomycetaceae bacterium]
MTRVLIVDDEPAICWAFRECLTDEGFEVGVASSAAQALASTDDEMPDVIVMDVRMPGMDGLEAMQQFRKKAASIPIIIMTAFGSLSTAVRAIDGGAFDYLIKPIDLDKAVAVIRQAAAINSAPASGDEMPAVDCASDELIVGSSSAMQEVFRQIALVAERDVPVLITGESGTGKDLVARAIHQHSRRRGPFVPICVPAFSDTVVESELFGHTKGAFTGADVARIGLLQQADQGTAFVDEIGEIPLPLQVKLLRVLETHEVQPVGSGTCRHSSFRLVAATNRSLETMVAEGTFRSDLFYRLNVFRIHLPPLRERTDDILLLAERFLSDVGIGKGMRLSDEAQSILLKREWTGNVRELRNAIEAASVVCRGEVIRSEHLPEPSHQINSSGRSPVESLQLAVTHWIDDGLNLHGSGSFETASDLLAQLSGHTEPPLLRRVLDVAGGNRALAARMLGIHRDTLREKLRRYGIDAE